MVGKGDCGDEGGNGQIGGGSEKVTMEQEGPEMEGRPVMVADRSQQKGRISFMADRGVCQIFTFSNGSSE